MVCLFCFFESVFAVIKIVVRMGFGAAWEILCKLGGTTNLSKGDFLPSLLFWAAFGSPKREKCLNIFL